MTTFQILIRKFWVKVEKPIWSFIVNLCFWIGHLNKINEAREIKRLLLLQPLEQAMQNFVWVADNWQDWSPWTLTIASRLWTDDCDGAAVMARWWFKKHGIKSEIMYLFSDKSGHAVCVTKDRTKMVSNDRVVDLNPATWEADVLSYFGGKYTVMF